MALEAHSIKCPRCDGLAIVGWGRNEQWCDWCHGTGIVLGKMVEPPLGLAVQG